MKLLLTSSGLTNDSIAKALFDLTGKKPEETTIVFIPTASNVCVSSKCVSPNLIERILNWFKRLFG